MARSQTQRMQCMEVWGGNQEIDRDLQTTGLDVWVYSQPHETSQSGGDVYYVSSCASGRITRLLLADVSGHGDAVADRADVLRQLMRRNINIIDQSALVNAINREFIAECNNGVFASALIGTFFCPTQVLSISNAGHPSPFVYRVETGRWQQLTSRSANDSETRHFPLGIAAEQDYSDIRTKLYRGDLVLWFTDGLSELRGSDGSLLGAEGVLKLLSTIETRNPHSMIKQLLDQAVPTERAVNSVDDISLIAFQLNDERVSLRDNLLAPFRAAASLFEQVRDRGRDA